MSSAPLSPSHSATELARIWRTLARQNEWPEGQCPQSEREQWVGDIAHETGLRPAFVEMEGIWCGVLPYQMQHTPRLKARKPVTPQAPAPQRTTRRRRTWQRICRQCQSPFEAKVGNQAFCTPDCREQAEHARGRVRPHRTRKAQVSG